MKNLLLCVCLFFILSKYVNTRELALQALELARHELQAADLGEQGDVSSQPRLTRAGQGPLLAERVRDLLREFTVSEEFQDARVELARVDFIRTPSAPTEQTHRLVRTTENPKPVAHGYYAVTLAYDMLQPLNRSAGTALIASVCRSGAGEVRLNDGNQPVKAFRCASAERRQRN